MPRMNSSSAYSAATGSGLHEDDLFNVWDTSASSGNVLRCTFDVLRDYLTNYGGGRWRKIDTADFTATPASTSTITFSVDYTGSVKPGMPIKYAISGTTYYGMLTTVASGLWTIAGATMGGALQSLYVGTPEMLRTINFYVPGVYDAGVADQLCAVTWYGPPAYVVNFAAAHVTPDGGATEPKLNIEVAGSAVSSNDTNLGITMSASANTWVSHHTASPIAINTTNYSIAFGEEIRPTLTAAGAAGTTAADLSVTVAIVVA
jgi:hypothetical protein